MLRNSRIRQLGRQDHIRLQQAAYQGDAAAQEKLLEAAYYHGVRAAKACCRRFRIPETDAEDIVQDCMVKIIHQFERKSVYYNFVGWVYTVIRHHAIDWLRIRAGRLQIVIGSIDDPLNHREPDSQTHADILAAVQSNPEDVLLSEGLEKKVDSEINNFPEETRQVIRLHIAGYGYAEIAAKLGIAMGTVPSRIYRFRKHLASRLK